MLQYLLDDYMEGYNLPSRRLQALPWKVNKITTKLELYAYTCDKEGIVAIKFESDSLRILAQDGKEYRIRPFYDHTNWGYDLVSVGYIPCHLDMSKLCSYLII